jgi:hypothetical protein
MYVKFYSFAQLHTIQGESDFIETWWMEGEEKMKDYWILHQDIDVYGWMGINYGVLTGKKSTAVEIRPNLSNIYIIVTNMKDEHFNVQNTSSAHMKVFDLLDPNT